MVLTTFDFNMLTFTCDFSTRDFCVLFLGHTVKGRSCHQLHFLPKSQVFLKLFLKGLKNSSPP
jgi:hypothetical protein